MLTFEFQPRPANAVIIVKPLFNTKVRYIWKKVESLEFYNVVKLIKS